MLNSIAFAQNYTSVIDEVYQRASVSDVLNSGRRMVRADHNAKEILIPKISMTGLGDYTRNVGYKTGAITDSPGRLASHFRSNPGAVFRLFSARIGARTAFGAPRPGVFRRFFTPHF